MPATPVITVDEFGIHSPDFPTILAYFENGYRAIYGSDVYISPDSQDGELLGLFATAINDTNAAAVQCYNSFSPSTAVGTGLSSVVKINGIRRKVPSRSNATVRVVGQADTVITNGVAVDDNGIQWMLPGTVIIPYSGEIIVTVVCSILGQITAPVGTINAIENSQPGWQTVSNISVAAVGSPVETDAQLRRRQVTSTEIPSLGLLEGLAGSLWALTGVRSVTVYENTTNIPDANGIPGHCLAVVIDGGDLNQIGAVIQDKKGGGVGTYGNNEVTISDKYGIPHDVAFFRPVDVPVTWSILLRNLGRFSMNTQASIATTLSDWTNALGVGSPILIKRAYVPANLGGATISETYELLSLKAARDGSPAHDADVAIAFNERAFCDPSYVTFSFPPGD